MQRFVLILGALAGCVGSTSTPSDCGADGLFDGNECVFPGAPGPTGFPDNNNSDDDTAFGFGICNPRQAGACDNIQAGASTGRTCCSDDPASQGGALPAFAGRASGAGFAAPYFAGPSNAVGISGMCVDTGATQEGLVDNGAEGCPVPCNPTWSSEDQEAVCGPDRVCCQTRALQAADCVEDGGTQRPVTGEDIPNFTDWAPASHATHQDPGGTGCSLAAGGDQTSAEFTDCVLQLTVANQRGFCVAATSCPSLDQPC